MHHIYVCLFTGGLLKIGRSINPTERIQSHRDRLYCAGIDLVSSRTYKCIGSGPATEAYVLRHFRGVAKTVRGNEWFTGVDYDDACSFVEVACQTILDADPEMNWESCEIIEAIGGTGAASRIFDISKASVSDWKRKGIPPARMMYLKVRYAKHIKGFDLASATAISRANKRTV